MQWKWIISTNSMKRYVDYLNLAVHSCPAVGVNLELFLLLIIIDVKAPVAKLVRINWMTLAHLEVDQAECLVRLQKHQF